MSYQSYKAVQWLWLELLSVGFENLYGLKYPGKISGLKYIVEIHNTTGLHMTERNVAYC